MNPLRSSSRTHSSKRTHYSKRAHSSTRTHSSNYDDDVFYLFLVTFVLSLLTRLRIFFLDLCRLTGQTCRDSTGNIELNLKLYYYSNSDCTLQLGSSRYVCIRKALALRIVHTWSPTCIEPKLNPKPINPKP